MEQVYGSLVEISVPDSQVVYKCSPYLIHTFGKPHWHCHRIQVIRINLGTVFIQRLGQGDGNPYLATVVLGNIVIDLSQLVSQIQLCRQSVLESV